MPIQANMVAAVAAWEITSIALAHTTKTGIFGGTGQGRPLTTLLWLRKTLTVSPDKYGRRGTMTLWRNQFTSGKEGSQ